MGFVTSRRKFFEGGGGRNCNCGNRSAYVLHFFLDFRLLAMVEVVNRSYLSFFLSVYRSLFTFCHGILFISVDSRRVWAHKFIH